MDISILIKNRSGEPWPGCQESWILVLTLISREKVTMSLDPLRLFHCLIFRRYVIAQIFPQCLVL